MHTKYIQKYFENNASGSGQRYTLSNSTINTIPVLLPSKGFFVSQSEESCSFLWHFQFFSLILWRHFRDGWQRDAG